ncbi:FitA-like ribbon-helix-helix domain-containing protein [Neorhizobium galegae]|nr:plasmid stability protein stbC [Neorhizobium galegae]
MMNAITIRNLSDEASRALEARAIRNGTTAEAEIEQILEEVLLSKEPIAQQPSQAAKPLKLGTALWKLGQEFGGLELDITRDPAPIRPASFE